MTLGAKKDNILGKNYESAVFRVSAAEKAVEKHRAADIADTFTVTVAWKLEGRAASRPRHHIRLVTRWSLAGRLRKFMRGKETRPVANVMITDVAKLEHLRLEMEALRCDFIEMMEAHRRELLAVKDSLHEKQDRRLEEQERELRAVKAEVKQVCASPFACFLRSWSGALACDSLAVEEHYGPHSFSVDDGRAFSSFHSGYVCRAWVGARLCFVNGG